MTGILDRIVASVGRRLKRRMRECPPDRMRGLSESNLRNPASFEKAIRGKAHLSVIAELKRASPSSPRLAPSLDLLEMARAYQTSGAAAISVLTEEDHFKGHASDLWLVSTCLNLPALRKDFIIDEYQIHESKVLGASAVLLIVRALPRRTLRRLHDLARDAGLSALVEVHDERELDTALELGARVIGVNNRNLDTLETDLSTARRLLPLIPKSKIAVAESGYSKARDLAELTGLADAVLIGTAFLKNFRRASSFFR